MSLRQQYENSIRRQQDHAFDQRKMLASEKAVAQLSHAASWERDSRYRSARAHAQRAFKIGESDDEVPQKPLRQQFSELLAAEHAETQLALAADKTERDQRRTQLLTEAQHRSLQREEERKQVAEARELQRYARDSEALRQLSSAQRQTIVAASQAEQRASRMEQRLTAKQDELNWQETAIENDKSAAALQKARQDQHHAEQYQHAREIESQIDERNTQRQSQKERKQQEDADARACAQAEMLAERQRGEESHVIRRHLLTAGRQALSECQTRQKEVDSAKRAMEAQELQTNIALEEAQAAEDEAVHQAARAEDVRYRLQLEQDIEERAAQQKSSQATAGQESLLKMSATETAQAALNAVRQQRDREVAEFQKLQIVAKQQEREQEYNLARQQKATEALKQAEEDVILAHRARTQQQTDHQHWAAVQAQIDDKKASTVAARLKEVQTEANANAADAAKEARLRLGMIKAPLKPNYGYQKSQLF